MPKMNNIVLPAVAGPAHDGTAARVERREAMNAFRDQGSGAQS
jgi:hypothetical protein